MTNSLPQGKPENLTLNNVQLTDLLKKIFNKQGQWKLVIQFGLGAMELNGIPTAFSQVVGVGIEEVLGPEVPKPRQTEDSVQRQADAQSLPSNVLRPVV